ncbi:hypothetical protein BO71DRAFT_116314 [Aspergillus ellipticus CBS 707.79]|uniref:Uncharacterized protein n=1 Tax=Aspergillus ellipticus CBS 707.79 TaxID=1448320 RepID=A0A319DJM0_9EURO|nr:hypothetical protein BO71DRAFT_116314 [Aspergillus ellipticus CBS 707.79]
MMTSVDQDSIEIVDFHKSDVWVGGCKRKKEDEDSRPFYTRLESKAVKAPVCVDFFFFFIVHWILSCRSLARWIICASDTSRKLYQHSVSQSLQDTQSKQEHPPNPLLYPLPPIIQTLHTHTPQHPPPPPPLSPH